MGSKDVEDLRLLINKKMTFDRMQSIMQGLNYASIFVLIFSVVTETQSVLFLLSFPGAFLFGFLSSYYEKKSFEVKDKIQKILFK